MYLICLKGSSVLADIGTEQIEFIGLSQRTGNPKYKEKVRNNWMMRFRCRFYGVWLLAVLSMFALCWKFPLGLLLLKFPLGLLLLKLSKNPEPHWMHPIGVWFSPLVIPWLQCGHIEVKGLLWGKITLQYIINIIHLYTVTETFMRWTDTYTRRELSRSHS